MSADDCTNHPVSLDCKWRNPVLLVMDRLSVALVEADICIEAIQPLLFTHPGHIPKYTHRHSDMCTLLNTHNTGGLLRVVCVAPGDD